MELNSNEDLFENLFENVFENLFENLFENHEFTSHKYSQSSVDNPWSNGDLEMGSFDTFGILFVPCFVIVDHQFNFISKFFFNLLNHSDLGFQYGACEAQCSVDTSGIIFAATFAKQ